MLELRQRLEWSAVDAFDRVTKQTVRSRQSRITQKLTFILAIDQTTLSQPQVHALLRRARHVYSKSSDVLHGRVSMVNLPQVVVDEWREVVERVESLLEISPPDP